MNTGHKPPTVTGDKDEIIVICDKQTQQERTTNTNRQLTPITNAEFTPITNEQRTPVTNEQGTPATSNAQRSPNTNIQRTPITNVQRTPNVQRTANSNIQRDNMESLNATKQTDGTLQTNMTQLVRDVPKGPQNNVTPQTYRTLNSTNDVTPLTPLSTVSRRPGNMTQTANAKQQPQKALPTQQIDVHDSVTGQLTTPISQTNRVTLTRQNTTFGQQNMSIGGQTQTDVTILGLGDDTVLSGKPKPAARLFGTQGTPYTDLLSRTTDDDNFSLLCAVGGAIRHSYNCNEEDTNDMCIDNMDQLQSGACADCAFYKAQNDELRVKLHNP